MLEHRWFLSEQAGSEVPIREAADGYMNTVLKQLPDEAVAMSLDSMGTLQNPYDPSQGYADDAAEKPYDPWEDSDEGPNDDNASTPAYLDIDALRRRKPGSKNA